MPRVQATAKSNDLLMSLNKVSPITRLNEGRVLEDDEGETSHEAYENEDDINKALAKKSIDRKQSTVLDHETKFYMKENGLPEPRFAHENKKLYFENYVVNFVMPAVYVIDAHILRSKPTYSMQLTRYIFPNQTDFSIQSHNVDGSNKISKYQDTFKKYENSIQLRILQRQGQLMKTVFSIDLEGMLEGLIKFSPDDKIVALLDKTRSILTFYEFNEDIIKLIENIENENFKSQFDARSEKMDLAFIEKIKFDPSSKYFLGFGENKIFIFDREESKVEIIDLNKTKISQVNDACLLLEEAGLRCLVACKKQNLRQVAVFDILENHKEVRKYIKSDPVIFKKPSVENHSIRYFNLQFNSTEYLKLKISSDLDQIVLTDIEEKFILSELNGSLVQRKLTLFQNKVVHFIKEDQENHSFYLLYSKDYDSKLYLGHADKSYANVRFPRNVEPGAIRVFDIFVSNETEGSDLEGQDELQVARMLSLEDDDFVLDKAIYSVKSQEDQMPNNQIALNTDIKNKISQHIVERASVKYFQYVSSTMRALSMKWPYVAFQGLFNALIVINAFDRKLIHRIELAKEWESIAVSETYITNSNDLFVMILQEDQYFLYLIDLDQSNMRERNADRSQEDQYSLGEPILIYHKKDVEGQQLKDLHVRGSSRKESIDSNHICQVFIQHGDSIYHWIKYKENKKNQELVFLSKTASKKFNRKSDHCFFFLRNLKDMDDNLVTQDIMRVNINFSTIEVVSSFNDSAQVHDIHQFNYDDGTDRFIILFKNKTKILGSSRYSFKIQGVEQQNTLFEKQIYSQKLIGRFKSGLYTFQDGHIYFNNEVIKIRYDLIESVNNQAYKENEIFDFYDNIFILDDNQKVRSNTPLESLNCHRFGYITFDKSQKSCRYIMLLPYLHERRIYLNRLKTNTDYFYTSVETKPTDEDQYHEDLIENLSKRDTNLIQSVTKKFYSQRNQSERSQENNQSSIFKDLPETFTSIICMNETEYKYYVYTQDGLLINRVDFKKLVKLYGPPLSTSGNGLNFIFKKNHDYDAIKDVKELRQKMFTISVMNMSIFGLIHIKDVNLLEEISKENQNCWLFNEDKDAIIQHVKFKFTINDRFDICVKIYCESDEDEFALEQEKETFYVYEPAYKNLKSRKINKLSSRVKDMLKEDVELHQNSIHKQRIMKVQQAQKEDFMINIEYLFIWNPKKIRFFQLDKDLNEANTKHMRFEISEKNQLSCIREIRTGSAQDMIVIIISQSNSTDTIFTWDVEDDIELESNDVGKNYEILWDYKGYPYIIQNGEVNFTKERCTIKAFDFQELEELSGSNSNAELSSKKGHRFDGKNHNWLILGEYISLPFSYMSFVIKDKLEIEIKNEIPNTNEFDPEPYNYIFNRSTSFLDGDLVYARYQELQKVLLSLKEIDPKYLEIINYRQDLLQKVEGKTVHVSKQIQETQSNTALHLAIKLGNKKSTDLILMYMAKIPYNSSKNFQDIFHELIEFQSFQTYLQQLPHQTKIMKKKQIIRVQDPYDDHVIKMGFSHLNYVDDKYFQDNFGEVSDMATGTNTYPVKIVSLKIGWILRKDNGRKFLDELLLSKNLDFFNMSTLQMLIKFFYSQFKSKLFYYLMQFYLLQLIMYETSMHTLEYYIHALYVSESEDKKHLVLNEESAKLRKALLVIVSFNFFLVLIQIVFIAISITKLRIKKIFLYRFYNWVDVIFIFLNLFIVFDIYIMLSNFKLSEEELSQEVGDKLSSQKIYLYTTHDTIEQFAERAKFVRNIEVFGEIFIVMKAVQFLSLHDKLAPIIDIVVEIFFDISWFMIILILNGLVFASAFYILSQNQIMFDDLSPKEIEGINYKSLSSSMWYIHDLILGTADHANFAVGNNPSQKTMLYGLYFFVTFLMLIHLTNMLIAIMGETFGKRREVAEQIKMKDQLRFVMDNWHWKYQIFDDIKQVKYIIAAFSIEDDKNDNQEINYLRNDLKTLSKQILESFNENTIQNKEIMNQNRGMLEEIKLLKKLSVNQNQSMLQ